MNGNSRALVVLPTGIRGGAEAVSFALVENLCAKGWFVDLLIMSRGMQPSLARLSTMVGVRVVAQEYGSEKSSLPMTIYRIFRLARIGRYDLVYSTHLHVNAMLGLMRKVGLISGSRLIGRESTVIFERYFGFRRAIFKALYYLGYGVQDLLILQTPEMLASLRKSIPGRLIQNARVVPNPIDLEAIRARIPEGEFTDCKRKRIVACGRLVKIKGFPALIEAFGLVAGDFPFYDLEIIGGGDEDVRLRADVEKRGLRGRVIFHGLQQNPWRLMSGAEIGVVSSVKEGFPNVLLEMMASGVKRIVTTPCTDWVNTIPDVTVSSGIRAEDIADVLREAMRSTDDRSSRYREYLKKTHSMQAFTDIVIGHA